MIDRFVKKTQFVEGEGLKIPVIDLSLGEGGKSLAEPETLRNSILELLFEPEELESFVIVKLDKQDESLDPLAKVRFEDGIARRVAFSSGNNVYFADARQSERLIQFFETQKDHACRYGSLLISSCNEGASLIDGTQDNKPLRIKIVSRPKSSAIAHRKIPIKLIVVKKTVLLDTFFGTPLERV
jgi:hypothetical protein